MHILNVNDIMFFIKVFKASPHDGFSINNFIKFATGSTCLASQATNLCKQDHLIILVKIYIYIFQLSPTYLEHSPYNQLSRNFFQDKGQTN